MEPAVGDGVLGVVGRRGSARNPIARLRKYLEKRDWGIDFREGQEM